MKRYGYFVLIIIAICLIKQVSWASRAYVTDSFEITLRTGPSIQNKVIAMPPSGQAVDILESKDDWSLVQIVDRDQVKAEGWVRSRYLINRMPWKLQTESLKAENSALKEKLNSLESNLENTTSKQQDLTKNIQETSSSLTKLKKDYEELKRGAANYLELKSEYESATSALEATKKTALALTKENDKLKASQRNRWFATGALVLLGGLVIGLVLGRQQKKRKSLYY